MNEGSSQSFKSINILSQKRSSDNYSGALTVSGGVGIKKNLYVKEEIITNELITNNNARIGKNIYVMGTIESDQMFYLEKNGDMVMKRNIVPFENSDIGSYDYKWKNVYTNKLHTDMLVHDNYQEVSIEDNEMIINIDSDIVLLDNKVYNGIITMKSINSYNSVIFIKIILEKTVGPITVFIGSDSVKMSNIGEYIELMNKGDKLILLKKIEI